MRIRPCLVPASRCSSGETVSFKTSTGTKLFFAHEDLLCRRSNFFRLSLQKKRKVIDEDCLVCLEELDARKADIVWCKTTGGKNFHADCIKRWHQSSILCPGCKQRWASQTPNTLTIPAVLEEAVLQDYLDSIYANNIRTPPGLAVHDGTLSLWLFQMWEICNVLQDFELRKMIVSRHMGMCLGMDTSYWLASVKFTPPRLPRHERIRAYIVDVFVWKNDLDFFEHHA